MKNNKATQASDSGFYIVNCFDRPEERLLAEKRSDGKFYYIHPDMRDDKQYWGMNPDNPTAVEAFGLMVDVKAGVLVGASDGSLVSAVYEDGRPRKWQGSTFFSFYVKSEG